MIKAKRWRERMDILLTEKRGSEPYRLTLNDAESDCDRWSSCVVGECIVDHTTLDLYETVVSSDRMAELGCEFDRQIKNRQFKEAKETLVAIERITTRWARKYDALKPKTD